MGLIGIPGDEGRRRPRYAGFARCPKVLVEHGNPFDLSISVKGGEETKADSVSIGE